MNSYFSNHISNTISCQVWIFGIRFLPLKIIGNLSFAIIKYLVKNYKIFDEKIYFLNPSISEKLEAATTEQLNREQLNRIQKVLLTNAIRVEGLSEMKSFLLVSKLAQF